MNLISEKLRKIAVAYFLVQSIPLLLGYVNNSGLRLIDIPCLDSPFYFSFLLIVALVVSEFYWYWIHYCNHRFNFLWAIHEFHHSSIYFNYSVAARTPVIFFAEGLLGIYFLAFLGFPQEIVSTLSLFTIVYVFLTHSDHSPEMPALSKVFITPYDHSKHHESDFQKQHSNYGQILSIYDHLFKTYNRDKKTYLYGCLADYKAESVFEAQFLPLFRYIKKVLFEAKPF